MSDYTLIYALVEDSVRTETDPTVSYEETCEASDIYELARLSETLREPEMVTLLMG